MTLINNNYVFYSLLVGSHQVVHTVRRETCHDVDKKIIMESAVLHYVFVGLPDSLDSRMSMAQL